RPLVKKIRVAAGGNCRKPGLPAEGTCNGALLNPLPACHPSPGSPLFTDIKLAESIRPRIWVRDNINFGSLPSACQSVRHNHLRAYNAGAADWQESLCGKRRSVKKRPDEDHPVSLAH